jgi:16S rRNA G966 N2-methylase RsmD
MTMAKHAPAARPRSSSASTLDPLIERLNSFSADNYWDLGKFLNEKVLPAALKEGIFGDQILKRLTDLPGFKFPYQMLKHCQRFYTYYPDVEKRPLPEAFYFELATKVEDSRRRDQYEKMAIQQKMTISDLQKRIRDDEVARREDERTKFGFDLKEKNVWSFDAPDPRFGKAGHRGRLAGQIVANALFYYTGKGAVIVDPMAGSGTTGDVVESVAHFGDRTVKMYDIEPSDQRIVRANVLQTGIPEQSGSADYVFLDPPAEFYPREEGEEISASAAKTEAMMKFKPLVRESVRILKSGGRVSVVVEAASGAFGVVDFPFEVGLLMKELGLHTVGKVYLPRRTEPSRPKVHASAAEIRPMVSECRELLTFQKP